ncbi:MAG: flavodoxin domain-containing protein [Alphaproteobacteria bacterium]|nr:flavodoxin domain-containing protein [Alphaproteobacteria bacterium]
MSDDTKPRLSRRRVLKWSGLTLAALAAGGIGWQFRPVVEAQFPEIALSDAEPGRLKLLIVYGSKLGSTGEQAVWMGETAAMAGFAVQVARAENAPPADAFDAVIVGSAIRSSKWLPEVIDWVAVNRDALAAKPAALFEACMTVAGIIESTPDHRLGPAHLASLAEHLAGVHAAAPALKSAPAAFLPGCLDYEKMSPMLRVGFPIATGRLSSGDFRDKDMVRGFTESAIAGFAA